MVSNEEIIRQIAITGRAARWQEVPQNLIRFGSLTEKMYDLEQKEFVRVERLESDKKRLNDIENYLKN